MRVCSSVTSPLFVDSFPSLVVLWCGRGLCGLGRENSLHGGGSRHTDTQRMRRWIQKHRYAANTEVDPDTDTQRIRRWIQTYRYAALGSTTEGAATPGVPHPPRAKTETRQNIKSPRAQVSCSKLFTPHCREISLRANWTNYPPTLTHTHTHTSVPTGKGILPPKATQAPPTS